MSEPTNRIDPEMLLTASLTMLPGGLTLPNGITFKLLGDNSHLAEIDFDGPKKLEFGGVTLATLNDLRLLVTVTADGSKIVAEVDATLQLGPEDSPIELQLSGVFTNNNPASSQAGDGEGYVPFQDWSLELTAVAMHGLPLGKLVADLIPGLPESLTNFAVNDLRLSLRWDAGPPVVSEILNGTPAITQSTVFQLMVTGRLGGDDPWEVIPGLLSLTGPRLVVGIEGGHKFLEVYERLELFGLWWWVQLQLPAGVGSAELITQGMPNSGPVTMESFVSSFGLHDPTNTLSSIGIKCAAVRFDAHNHLFGVNLELAPATKDSDGKINGWSLIPGEDWLTLDDVAFDLVHTPAGVAGRASASLTLGNANFRVSLEHPGPGLGWQIDAICDFAEPRPSLSDLHSHFGVPTGDLPRITLSGVSFSYDTLTSTLALELYGILGHAHAQLSLTRSKGADVSPVWDIQGQIIIKDAILAFALQKGTSETDMVASYAAGGSGGLSLGDLISALDPDLHLDGVDLTLQSALFVNQNPKEGASTKLIAADLALEISSDALHKIPVLGERLSKDARFGLNIHVIYASQQVTDTTSIVSLLPTGVPVLPSSVQKGFGSTTVDVLIGTQTIPLGGIQPTLAVQGSTDGATKAPGTPDTTPPTPPPTPVHQNLGGVVNIQSMRPGLNRSIIELAVDGSVRFGPVTMSVIGLTLGYDLKKKKPIVPSLHGLSLLLDKPPVRVEGGFLLVDGTAGQPSDFVGKAEITTSKFSLTALGGFTMIGGSPSLFVYGVLNMPLGGPPFFFVEGLAAGFGLNRHLTLPTIDNVETFPLVQAAIPGAPPIDLEKLHDELTPKLGSFFFAAGVKFNSFRMIHGFLLALVDIDIVTGDYEVALVGTGEWVSPPEAQGVERMAYVRLDILAVMSSRDASLIVQAKLGPDCFVNNPLCHISGGMALATWYAGEHKDDFVLTVGGYHPAFTVPSHYPVPGRLTLDYQISDGLHAGGSLYFALTPSYLMFGFTFNATWHTGPVSAWFDLGLDFLMKFKPLHYDATGHIEIGASVDLWLFTISVSAGADLHIWGPDFGGHADVHLGPFHHGMDFGSPIAPPPPLTADEFKQAFLPPVAADVLSIRPAGGLRTTVQAAVPADDPFWQKVAGRKPDPAHWPDELRDVPTSVVIYANGAKICSTNRKVLEYMVDGQLDSSHSVEYQEFFFTMGDAQLTPVTTLTDNQKTAARAGSQTAPAAGATVYVQAFQIVCKQPVWSFNPKELAIEIESLAPLNQQVNVPPMSEDKADGLQAEFTFALTLTVSRKDENAVWASYATYANGKWDRSLNPLNFVKKRYPPALWKADDVEKMDGTTRIYGGAKPLDQLHPVQSFQTRADLSEGAGGTGFTSLDDQSSFPDQPARNQSGRTTARTTYQTKIVSSTSPVNFHELLDALATSMGDPALKAVQNPGRKSAALLLDPPLLIGNQ